MNQIKIGKFIAERRKMQNLTQMQLAEKLNITDRVVSKWECGKCLPDASVMLELCDTLEISVNELLTGEKLEMENYNKQAELNLIEMKKQKEETDKVLLNMEAVVVVIGTLFLLTLCLLAAFIEMATWLKIGLIAFGFIVFIPAAFIAVRIEQKAGYYECAKCHHRYVPTYAQSLNSMHFGRTKYLKCPNCGKRSWNKKVLSKEDKEDD